MTKTRLIRLLVSILIGVAIAAAIAAYQIKDKNDKQFLPLEKKTTSVVAKDFGGPFTLTNHLGEKVTEKDFENQYRLIYFGFTYCPAICPTELQRMARVVNDLGTDGEEITQVFVTVDPERDTIETMKEYVSLFHPKLIGLTGTQEQIDEIKKAYKIYSAKVQEEGMNDYTVDHSSFIYFMGPDNSLIRIFKMDDSVEHMVSVIKSHL